eukprot:425046-Pleurochrysis_carterae.AAC.4
MLTEGRYSQLPLCIAPAEPPKPPSRRRSAHAPAHSHARTRSHARTPTQARTPTHACTPTHARTPTYARTPTHARTHPHSSVCKRVGETLCARAGLGVRSQSCPLSE